MIKSHVKMNKFTYIMLVLFIVYWFRLLFLDSDVKNFYIAQIQPSDELYYNEVGIRLARYGLGGFIFGSQASLVTISNAKNYFLPSILSGLSLKIVGNTFWGIKVPYVCIGFVCLLLVVSCVHKLTNNAKLMVTAATVFVFDANILMISREGVTVGPCLLAVLILFRVMISDIRETRKYALLGFLPVIFFCQVYMGLPFLILVGFLYVMKQSIIKKKKLIFILYLFGNFAGLISSEIVSRLFFHQSIIKTITDTFSAHGDKINGVSSSLYSDLLHIIHYFMSNAFKLNFLVLFLTICSLSYCLYAFVKKKDQIAFDILIFILCHWAQTILLDNMTESKATITFPIALIGIAYTASKKEELHELFEKHKRSVNFCIILILFESIGIEYAGRNSWGLDSQDKIIIMIASCLVAGLILISMITRRASKMMALKVSGFITFFVMIAVSAKYVYMNLTYDDRTMLMDIGKTTENGRVINVTGYSLYNYCECPASIYDHYKGVGYDYKTMYADILETVENSDVLYWVGYSDDSSEWNPKYVNENILVDTDYEFVPIKKYSRHYYSDTPGGMDVTLFVRTEK